MKWQFVVMYDHDIGVHVYLDKNRILDTGGRVKPESTEGGRLVSILRWPEGAPLNLG